jgi:hypothetical protein
MANNKGGGEEDESINGEDKTNKFWSQNWV